MIREIVAYVVLGLAFLLGLGMLTFCIWWGDNPRDYEGTTPRSEAIEAGFFGILSLGVMIWSLAGLLSIPSWW